MNIYVCKILNSFVPNLGDEKYNVSVNYHDRAVLKCVIPVIYSTAPNSIKTLKVSTFAVTWTQAF